MRVIVWRLGALAVVLLVVTVFTTLLLDMLPGDVAETVIPFGTDAQRDHLRADLGLDDPFHIRYARWLGDFLTGDFGNFYRQGNVTPVADRVADAAPISLLLVLYAQVIALLVAVPLGVLTAARAGTFVDKAVNSTTFAIVAIPGYVLALLLAFVFGVKLGWFDPQGYAAPGDGLIDHARSMTLPAVSLAAGQIAIYMRLLRTDMVATLQQDFILLARAKGLPPRRVLWGHALRSSSLTLITIAGLNVGTLVGGAIIIEHIFNLHGMGTLIFEAVAGRQIVALQSLVALVAVAYVLVNFAVDLLYTAVDPRIRHAHR